MRTPSVFFPSSIDVTRKGATSPALRTWATFALPVHFTASGPTCADHSPRRTVATFLATSVTTPQRSFPTWGERDQLACDQDAVVPPDLRTFSSPPRQPRRLSSARRPSNTAWLATFWRAGSSVV